MKKVVTTDDGSYEGKSLVTWHCSNVGKSLLGTVGVTD